MADTRFSTQLSNEKIVEFYRLHRKSQNRGHLLSIQWLVLFYFILFAALNFNFIAKSPEAVSAVYMVGTLVFAMAVVHFGFRHFWKHLAIKRRQISFIDATGDLFCLGQSYILIVYSSLLGGFKICQASQLGGWQFDRETNLLRFTPRVLASPNPDIINSINVIVPAEISGEQLEKFLSEVKALFPKAHSVDRVWHNYYVRQAVIWALIIFGGLIYWIFRLL